MLMIPPNAGHGFAALALCLYNGQLFLITVQFISSTPKDKILGKITHLYYNSEVCVCVCVFVHVLFETG